MNQYPINWISYRGRMFQSLEHLQWWVVLVQLGYQINYRSRDMFYTFPSVTKDYQAKRTGQGRCYTPAFFIGHCYFDVRPENKDVDEATLGKMLAQNSGEEVLIVKGTPKMPQRGIVTNPVTRCRPHGPIQFDRWLTMDKKKIVSTQDQEAGCLDGRLIQALTLGEHLPIGLGYQQSSDSQPTEAEPHTSDEKTAESQPPKKKRQQSADRPKKSR